MLHYSYTGQVEFSCIMRSSFRQLMKLLLSVSKVSQHFVIESMHVHAYRLSRDYITKHVLFETIARTVEANKESILVDRTPRWLVSKYLQHERMRGVYYDDEDDDCETYTPRHVHRGEVYSLLARYCDEIRVRIRKEAYRLDYLTWTEFCEIVQARREGDVTFSNCDELESRWPDPNDVQVVEPQVEVVPAKLNEDANFSHTVSELFFLAT